MQFVEYIRPDNIMNIIGHSDGSSSLSTFMIHKHSSFEPTGRFSEKMFCLPGTRYNPFVYRVRSGKKCSTFYSNDGIRVIDPYGYEVRELKLKGEHLYFREKYMQKVYSIAYSDSVIEWNPSDIKTCIQNLYGPIENMEPLVYRDFDQLAACNFTQLPFNTLLELYKSKVFIIDTIKKLKLIYDYTS